MKTKVSKSVVDRIAIMSISFIALFLFFQSCGKKEMETTGGQPALTPLEQKMVGQWSLKRSELYEIVGIDSAGQLECVLVGHSAPDSCGLELKAEFVDVQERRLRGIGAPEGCDGQSLFTWKVLTAGQLLADSLTYEVVWLGADSVALGRVYVSDVLKLKSVAYYVRQ